MANTFATLAAILLAISSFYAFKNKDLIKGKVEEQTALMSQSNDLKEDIQENTALTKSEAATLEEEKSASASLGSKLEEVKGQVEAIKTQIQEKEDQKAANLGRIEQARVKLDGLGPIEDLLPKFETAKAELAELQAELPAKEARLSSLVNRVKNSAESLKRTNEEKDGKVTDLRTSIRSVFANRGFVTLNSGDRGGVATKSILHVVRGGEVIAQLRVTSVESNVAAAQIVDESLKSGFNLRSGDTVVSTAPASENDA